jgi:perosamine synthetase
MRTIPILRPHVSPRAVEAAAACLGGTWIGSGPRVAEFESAIAQRLDCAAFVATSSGTAALTIAYDLAGIKAGDYVVTTPLTCVATNLPLLQRGAQLLWADIDMDGTLSPTAVRDIDQERLRAIVCVDFAGLPSRLDELSAVAHAHGASLIEDAAHSFGATFGDRPVGNGDHFTCFSFQAVKMLTTVDGGGVAMGAADAAARARQLRWFGLERGAAAGERRRSQESGYKAEMNDVSAAIGLANLYDVDSRLSKNAVVASRYAAALTDMSGLRMPQASHNGHRRSSHWLFPLLVERRDDFKRALAGRGVECEQLHYPNDTYGVFANVPKRELPNTRTWETQMVCIPIGDWLTVEDVEYTIEAIRQGW